MSFEKLRKRLTSASGITNPKKSKTLDFELDSGDELHFEMEDKLIDRFLVVLQDERAVFKIANTLAKIISPRVADAVVKLQNKVDLLEKELLEKNARISEIYNKCDELEQYGRRKGVRISGIIETQNEDTDQLVIEVGKIIDVAITGDDINRSHRVGPPGAYDPVSNPRSIIVRFKGYYIKQAFMKNAKRLKNIRPPKTKTNAGVNTTINREETSLKTQETSGTLDIDLSHVPSVIKRNNIFINDDVTKLRSTLAFKARQLLKKKKISQTWCSDGIIFIKTRDGSTKLGRNINEFEAVCEATKIKMRFTKVGEATTVSQSNNYLTITKPYVLSSNILLRLNTAVGMLFT
ncbi:hypothetical protein SNE40_018921 [Patella caerulea]|uniref:Uncharacterized protein n=1 Tax=Patella caerulea TaxID=87958 RepID=A0AAN8PHD5_PATCE